MRTTIRVTTVMLAAAIALCASTAFAAPTIYEGKGVNKTRLGWNDKKAAKSLSGTYKVRKDTSYSYAVYHWYVGKRLSNKRYPIELFAKSNRRVYRYHINSKSYATTAGVRVGSTVDVLSGAYPNLKGPYTSGTYKYYRLKHTASYTEFYCKNGVVSFIVVRK